MQTFLLAESGVPFLDPQAGESWAGLKRKNAHVGLNNPKKRGN
jgi:hypothetical protein